MSSGADKCNPKYFMLFGLPFSSALVCSAICRLAHLGTLRLVARKVARPMAGGEPVINEVYTP